MGGARVLLTHAQRSWTFLPYIPLDPDIVPPPVMEPVPVPEGPGKLFLLKTCDSELRSTDTPKTLRNAVHTHRDGVARGQVLD